MPIVLPLSSCSLLPFLHVYFHVVVNWFPHLSIATTPNTSLPASWVNRKMCPQGYERDSLKCFFPLVPPPPPPPPAPGKSLALLRTSVSTLELDHSNSSSPFSLSLNRGLFYTQYNVIPREKTSANPDMIDCSDYLNVPVPAPIT